MRKKSETLEHDNKENVILSTDELIPKLLVPNKKNLIGK
jgi:hypothetical protein